MKYGGNYNGSKNKLRMSSITDQLLGPDWELMVLLDIQYSILLYF
jgi:hypothetical protein